MHVRRIVKKTALATEKKKYVGLTPMEGIQDAQHEMPNQPDDFEVESGFGI